MPLRGLAVAVALCATLAAAGSPASAAGTVATVTDAAQSRFADGHVGLVSYAGRYRLGADIVNTGKGASLPAVTVPPNDPALNGFPTPASGHFLAFAASAEGVHWEPDARQVGGLYLSPRVTATEGTPPWVDVAEAGDRIDFGVGHYNLSVDYPAQPRRGGTGTPVWELPPTWTTVLQSANRRASGAVGVAMRTAYLHIRGGDVQANGLAVEPLRIALPPGPFLAADVNYLATTVSSSAGDVSLSWDYDAATRTVRITPVLSGDFRESSVTAGGVRNHVVAIAVLAFARHSLDPTLTVGTSTSLAVPASGRGALTFGRVGASRPALRVPVRGGRAAHLDIGPAADEELASAPDRSVDADASAAAAAADPPAVQAGSLAAVLGRHESTRGQISFDVTADHRGAPAVVAPTLTADGARFADAIGVPYLTGPQGVQALTAADVVDARFVPAAWAAKFGFYAGWLPGTTTVYYGTKPMPYVVAESTAYTYGATVDLVFRVSPTRFLHVETSLFEPQPDIGLGPFGEVVATTLGDQSSGLMTDRAAVLLATHGSTASVGSRDASAPLTTELDVPAGVSEPYIGPALSQNAQLASPEIRVDAEGVSQMLRPLVTYTDESRLVVVNAGQRMPVPARAQVPPRSLTPAAGLDVVVEGDGVYFTLD